LKSAGEGGGVAIAVTSQHRMLSAYAASLD
jgi:hypothetical protein